MKKAILLAALLVVVTISFGQKIQDKKQDSLVMITKPSPEKKVMTAEKALLEISLIPEVRKYILKSTAVGRYDSIIEGVKKAVQKTDKPK